MARKTVYQQAVETAKVVQFGTATVHGTLGSLQELQRMIPKSDTELQGVVTTLVAKYNDAYRLLQASPDTMRYIVSVIEEQTS
jgi:hypothetical protein